MRVVHLTNAGGFGRIQRGGAERAVAELSSILADDHGLEESVIAPEPFFAEWPLSPLVHRYGVDASAFSVRRAVDRKGPLRSLLTSIRPDVVVAHLLRGTLVGLPAARLSTKAARVAVLHNSLHDYRPDSILRRAKWRLNVQAFRTIEHRLVDAHVAISDANRNDLVEVDHVALQKVTVIHNWVAPHFDRTAAEDSRSTIRESLGLERQAATIVVAGRLEREKRQEFVIQLMPLLPTAHLLIVGDGSRLASLRHEAASHGVADRVQFLGHRSDIASIMGAADVVAVPSSLEGFGRVGVEALAVGTPVVASDLPSIREVLTGAPEGSVSLVPVDDRAQWINQLSLMLARGVTQKDRVEMANFVHQRYSLPAAARAYDALFRSLTDCQEVLDAS